MQNEQDAGRQRAGHRERAVFRGLWGLRSGVGGDSVSLGGFTVSWLSWDRSRSEVGGRAVKERPLQGSRTTAGSLQLLSWAPGSSVSLRQSSPGQALRVGKGSSGV